MSSVDATNSNENLRDFIQAMFHEIPIRNQISIFSIIDSYHSHMRMKIFSLQMLITSTHCTECRCVLPSTRTSKSHWNNHANDYIHGITMISCRRLKSDKK